MVVDKQKVMVDQVVVEAQVLLLEWVLVVQGIHLLYLHHKVIMVVLVDTLLEVQHQVEVVEQLLQVVMEAQVVELEVLEVLVRLIIFLEIVHHTLVVEVVEIIIQTQVE